MGFFKKLKEYKFIINEKTVKFKCNNNAKIVDFFISIIKKEEIDKNVINNDYKLKINWGYYIFKSINNEYIIYAPDYEKNPFLDLTEDLTLSLDIFNNQSALCNLTKLQPTESDFQDTIIIKKSVVNSNKLYFLRQQNQQGKDSGWFLGDMNNLSDSNNPDKLMVIKEF